MSDLFWNLGNICIIPRGVFNLAVAILLKKNVGI